MCDDRTDHDLDLEVSRRDLGLIAGSLALASAFPAQAASRPVIGRDVTIPMADGTAEAFFVSPAKGRSPGVILWTDIFGLRPAFRTMATRLAQSGYAVLVHNPFYRSSKAEIAPEGTPFDAAFRAKIMPMRALLTPDAVERDAKALVAFLDGQTSVNFRRKLGVAGYCMGGPLMVQTAAALPDRIGAGASFHGGGLATDKADSPHLLIPRTKARYLIAIAENDDKASPDDKMKLRAAFDAAKRMAEIEVYAGTLHGWCAIDSKAHNVAQADRAWGRMLTLFKKGLA
jgi:carboxymethylenebutenolidase